MGNDLSLTSLRGGGRTKAQAEQALRCLIACDFGVDPSIHVDQADNRYLVGTDGVGYYFKWGSRLVHGRWYYWCYLIE